MSLPILLIVVGIIVALLVHWALGVAAIAVGLVLLIIPAVSGRTTTTR